MPAQPITEKDQGEKDGEKQSDSETDDDDDGDAKAQSKILKQLQFPEMESGSSFSPDMCVKILRSLQKRMDKLTPFLTSLAEKPNLPNVLQQLGSKFCFVPLRKIAFE